MLRFALSLRFILLIEGAIAQVMGGTDVFLFGIVLVIFAYNIDFGFVFELGEGEKERLPGWMRPADVKRSGWAGSYLSTWSSTSRPIGRRAPSSNPGSRS